MSAVPSNPGAQSSSTGGVPNSDAGVSAIPRDSAGTIHRTFARVQEDGIQRAAGAKLGVLIQSDQYVGEVYSLGYSTALVQIHDHHRQKVGGIPSLSFLVATRITDGRT